MDVRCQDGDQSVPFMAVQDRSSLREYAPHLGLWTTLDKGGLLAFKLLISGFGFESLMAHPTGAPF